MAKLERELLIKLASMTGERAKIDAKTFDSYIVYRNSKGKIVREYPDGKIELKE
ncbi:hypothetical protein [Jeotgalibacillus aurantiacus]|uniref:hypothetical protein n=1 Tax=Jeotgalibacillus aurantiacus TaxID=2763266 RepID=UPI001D0B0BE7|nr:hypothetical protein [Jeotgalibacillus aurantiacus]